MYSYDKKPAIVKFIGNPSKYLDMETNEIVYTVGKIMKHILSVIWMV